ncbi:MAG: hypothetical protein HY985_11200 [Magnetospirillum sp.]|nr:hypothetical protein [Magnetospirillum sp.]
MIRAFAVLTLSLVLAAPAVGGERLKLVPGGADVARLDSTPAGPEVWAELFHGGSGLSFGAVGEAPSLDSAGGGLALGGYVAYALDGGSLAGSLKGDRQGLSADLSATHSGAFGTAALTLGYEWARGGQGFSPNLSHTGLVAIDPVRRPDNDFSLSLSFTRDITPSLSFGGFGAAPRSTGGGGPSQPESDLRFGAGVGVKF